MQEVFLVLWQKRAQIEPVGDSLRPWLLVTARFIAFNANRKRKTQPMLPIDPDMESVGDYRPESMMVAAAHTRALKAALGGLSPADRAVAQLCLVDGLSYKEAAGELSMTTSAIRNRLHRLRRSLQVQLSDLRGASHE